MHNDLGYFKDDTNIMMKAVSIEIIKHLVQENTVYQAYHKAMTQMDENFDKKTLNTKYNNKFPNKRIFSN